MHTAVPGDNETDGKSAVAFSSFRYPYFRAENINLSFFSPKLSLGRARQFPKYYKQEDGKSFQIKFSPGDELCRQQVFFFSGPWNSARDLTAFLFRREI